MAAFNDGDRQYPVNIGVLHHSTGPRFEGASELTVQDWFSTIGKSRAYQNGAINPQHEHPGRPGQLTYAQAQFAGTPDPTNRYNYRLIDLIADPYANVAWHAGNWDINVHSVGLENCGDFRNYYLEDRQLMGIANYFRQIDQELISHGYPNGITLMLHAEITATECPAHIKEQRDRIVDMINNWDRYEAEIFGGGGTVVPPKPEPVVRDEVTKQEIVIPFDTVTTSDGTLPAGEEKVMVEGVEGVREVTTTITYTDNVETNRKVATVILRDPIDKVIHIGTKEDDSDSTVIEDIKNLIKKLVEFILSIINKDKK